MKREITDASMLEENGITKEQSDQMSTFLFAETLKYFYLAFSGSEVNPETHVFNTEAGNKLIQQTA